MGGGRLEGETVEGGGRGPAERRLAKGRLADEMHLNLAARFLPGHNIQYNIHQPQKLKD